MTLNIPCRSNPMPYYTEQEPYDPDLIWHIDFSNGLTETTSNITGVKYGTNVDTYYNIQTDSVMGSYLKCTKNTNSYTSYVYWPGSKEYLNGKLLSSSPLTFSFWICGPSMYSYGIGFIFATRWSDNKGGLNVCDYARESKIFFQLMNPSNNQALEINNVGVSVNLSQWNHWVYVRDSSTWYLYLNGNLVKTLSVTSQYSAVCGDNVGLGIDFPPWNVKSPAYYDVTKFRLYNRILTLD